MHPTSDDRRTDPDLLISFVQRRDPLAIDAIVQRHGPMVMGVCRNILRNQHAAEDAFQATFLVLLNKADSIGKPASLASWLHGVACRVAKRARSQSKNKHPESIGQEMKSIDPATAASEEALSLIHQEIDQLPERFRLPLILCGIEGESREEVAQRLGWSIGSVKGRLERAREMLQIRLRDRGVILPAGVLSVLLAEQAIAQVPSTLAGAIANSIPAAASGQAVTTGAVSAYSISLSKEVIHAMLMTKIKFATALLCALFAAIGGSTLVVRQILAAPPGKQQAVANSPQAAPAQGKASKEAGDPDWSGLDEEQVDEMTQRHLWAVSYAMHAYLEKNGAFPPATAPNPKIPVEKRLSGLVLLLPYLGIRPSWLPENDERWQKWHADNAAAKELFQKIDLQKPWDDPVNAIAAKTLVPEFVVPGGTPLRDKRGYAVSHFAFVRGSDGHDNGAFPLDNPKKMTVKDIPDGTSVTAAIGQIQKNPGPWIAAGDSTARFLNPPSDEKAKPGFGGPHAGSAYIATCDGFVGLVDLAGTPKKALQLFAERQDEQILNIGEIKRYSNWAEKKAADAAK